MEDCSLENDFWEEVSEERFRETVMSTMEPDVIDGGSRIEGNSI